MGFGTCKDFIAVSVTGQFSLNRARGATLKVGVGGGGGGGGLTSDSKWGDGGGAENTFFSVTL